jgi:hypothetical protein
MNTLSYCYTDVNGRSFELLVDGQPLDADEAVVAEIVRLADESAAGA